jgi:hypothetical protein
MGYIIQRPFAPTFEKSLRDTEFAVGNHSQYNIGSAVEKMRNPRQTNLQKKKQVIALHFCGSNTASK